MADFMTFFCTHAQGGELDVRPLKTLEIRPQFNTRDCGN